MDEDLVRLLEARGMKHPGPEEAVEADNVLADEVIAFGLRILPVVGEVLAVLLAPVLQRGEITDRRIHPDVEVLVGIARDLEAEIRRGTRDAPAAERLLEPFEELVRDVARRVLGNPLLEVVVLRLELEVEMLGILDDGRIAAGRALGRAKLLGRIGRTALVAVVAVLVLGAALRTRSLHEAVGKEHLAVLAIELGRRLLGDPARLLHRRVELLGKRLVLRRICRVVVVEGNLEVGEVLEMDRVHAGDELLGGDALLARPDHDWRAMRVVGTHVDAVMPPQFLETHPEIGLDILHQMTQMNVTVGIRQRARNDNLSLLGHNTPEITLKLYQKNKMQGPAST